MATQGASISWNSAAGGSWATGSVGYTAYYKVESVSSSSITLRGNLAGYDNSATDITLNTSTKVWSDGDTGEPHEITNSSTWVSQSSTTTSNLLYLWQGSSTLLGALEIPSWGTTGGGSFLSNSPEITDITFAKIAAHEIQVDFKYDNIRVSTAQDPEYVMIKNVTRGTTLWSEHVSSAVSQQAIRSIVMNNQQGQSHDNLFGHGDLIQVMHSTPSYEVDYINYGTQVRTYTYMASGPYNVTFGPENPTGYIPVVIQDSNLFPDNGARPVFYDSTGNRMSDSNGVEFELTPTHDIHLNSTPAFYTAFALIKSETEPYCNFHIVKYYDAENGGYTGPEFHSRFGYKRNKKVSHNFW